MEPRDTQKRPALLTIEEVLAMLSISRDHFRRHVVKALPRVKIGRIFRYDMRDVEAWVEAQKVPPAPHELARPRAPARSAPRSAQALEIQRRLERGPSAQTLKRQAAQEAAKRAEDARER